jgi:shikimate kinase
MRFSFIGMSNIGKTYWSKRIASAKGVAHICCDALIEQQLGPELKQLGYHGEQGMAKWLGHPADAQYKTNSGRYTECEQKALRESLKHLRDDAAFPAVIDTTGSLIYTGADILDELRALTRIVYFEASDAHIDDLFRRYIAHPKPVIWGDSYRPGPDELPRETLRRCYPELLHARAQRYREIAHVTIPFEKHRNHGGPVEGLIEAMAA